MAENESSGGGGVLLGVLMGAVGGFVAGMVFAPKSGEITGTSFICSGSQSMLFLCR